LCAPRQLEQSSCQLKGIDVVFPTDPESNHKKCDWSCSHETGVRDAEYSNRSVATGHTLTILAAAHRGELVLDFRLPDGSIKSIEFGDRKPPLGMDFMDSMPLIVCNVLSHARDLGVKIGWELISINSLGCSEADIVKTHLNEKNSLEWMGPSELQQSDKFEVFLNDEEQPGTANSELVHSDLDNSDIADTTIANSEVGGRDHADCESIDLVLSGPAHANLKGGWDTSTFNVENMERRLLEHDSLVRKHNDHSQTFESLDSSSGSESGDGDEK